MPSVPLTVLAPQEFPITQRSALMPKQQTVFGNTYLSPTSASSLLPAVQNNAVPFYRANVNARNSDAGSMQTASLSPALFENAAPDASLLQEPYHHTLQKKKHSIPWDWLGIASVTGLGLTVPTLAMPITRAMDLNFIASFVGQDTFGFWVPRISVSLVRGAIPYDPKNDPEAQRRKGLNRSLYIFTQKAKRANWANLYEETMREVATAPGLLLWGSAGGILLKTTGRFTEFPEGRRCMEMPIAVVKEFSQAFQHHVVTQGLGQSNHNPANRHAFIKSFYQGLLKPEVNAQGEALLDKPLLIKQQLGSRASHADYNLSKKAIRYLMEADVDGLHELKQHSKPEKAVIERSMTLRHAVEQWAEAHADNALFDLAGGKKNPFSKQNAQLQARLSYWTRAIEKIVYEHNYSRPETHRGGYDQWNVLLGNKEKAFSIDGAHGVLHYGDKFRDFIVSTMRRVDRAAALEKQGKLPAPGSVSPTQRLLGASHGLKAASKDVVDHLAKLGVAKITLLSGLTFWWMWYLAHSVQSKRAYPANRMVSFNRPDAALASAPNANRQAAPASNYTMPPTVAYAPSKISSAQGVAQLKPGSAFMVAREGA